MVKCNHLVKQHQIHIPEILLLIAGQIQLWLTVLDIIIGEISYQTSRKMRHPFHHRTFIPVQNLTKRIPRMCYLFFCYPYLTFTVSLCDFQMSICTGDFHGRLVPKKRISSPVLCLPGTFQQVAMPAGFSQCAHHLHRCVPV